MNLEIRFIFVFSCVFVVVMGTGQELRDLLGIGKNVFPSLIPGDIKELLVGKYPVRPGDNHNTHCPLCDRSVYSYCSEKLFHDSCCCSGPYDQLPVQCKYADCAFLHANSCFEHRLITQCCCTNYILHKK